MKRIISIMLCIVLLIGVAFIVAAASGIGISVGTCIKADNGRYLVVIDNSPIAMHQRSGNKNIFENLETGDRIFATHNGIREPVHCRLKNLFYDIQTMLLHTNYMFVTHTI